LDEANGNSLNLMGTIVPSNNDEDSLSLSEYTDGEKSAPTELLAEFLTSIMKKDYANALKYCKLSKNFFERGLSINNVSKSFRLRTEQQNSARFLPSTSRQSS
jgi:hypothetical protein